MISILLIKKLIELFLIMIMGFALVKFKILNSKDSKSLSIISLYLVSPCVIINAFQVNYTVEKRNGLLLAFFAAIIIHIILLSLTKIFHKFLKLDEVERGSIIYSNSGNLIIPLVASILGPEWVIYSSAFVSVQLVIMWTHGKMLLSSENKINIKNIATNINFLSVVIGMILFISQIRFPEIVRNTLGSVGGIIGPISMIITGMLIGNVNLKKIFSYRNIYVVAFLKMIFYPFIALVFLKFGGLNTLVPNGKTILLITLLATITPSASTITQMSQIYGKDAEYASIINVTTTIICIITMPIIVMIYQL